VGTRPTRVCFQSADALALLKRRANPQRARRGALHSRQSNGRYSVPPSCSAHPPQRARPDFRSAARGARTDISPCRARGAATLVRTAAPGRLGRISVMGVCRHWPRTTLMTMFGRFSICELRTWKHLNLASRSLPLGRHFAMGCSETLDDLQSPRSLALQNHTNCPVLEMLILEFC
jgi:hypothetical protein